MFLGRLERKLPERKSLTSPTSAGAASMGQLCDRVSGEAAASNPHFRIGNGFCSMKSFGMRAMPRNWSALSI
ncbi:hypothetical protein TRIP_B200189 [uncultured Desulfatiglans sp.]|nr:hypothetical protein TRIP_B200189 [uncultured Desulfatiglans sp.]